MRQDLGAAQRHLDALRIELDDRLSALESALARPDSRSRLEELVMALARVATSEAESAAIHAALAARVETEDAAAAALAKLQGVVAAEHATAQALRGELAQAQSSLDVEREAIARLKRELEDLRSARNEASGAADRRVAELEQTLQRERERSTALDAALAQQHDATAQERATAERLWDTASTLRKELTAAQEAAQQTRQASEAAHRAALESLERRCDDAETRAVQARTERDELSDRLASLETKLAAAEQANEGLRRSVEARLAAAEAERARAADTETDRDALRSALETARQERADAERSGADAAARAEQARTERDELSGRLAVLETRLAAAEQANEDLRRSAEAASSAATVDAKSMRLLKAAAERIRVLEAQLAERERAPAEELDLAPAARKGPPVLEQAGQRARRFGFPPRTKIRIDQEDAQLVDLSMTGAQVICKTSPEVGREVIVTLPSDVAPCFGQGRLLWARREPAPGGRSPRYRVGLVFTDVDQAAIDTFIKHHSAT